MEQMIRVKMARVLLLSVLFTQNGILQASGAWSSSHLTGAKLVEENEIVKLKLSDNVEIDMTATSSDAYISDDGKLQNNKDNQGELEYGEIATSSNAYMPEESAWEEISEFEEISETVVLEEYATMSNAYRLGNGEEVWDGVTVKEVFPQNSIYNIQTPDELAWVMKITNDGKESFAGKTISINNDLDFGGYEWEGIGNFSNPFKGNVAGNGCTIRGIKQIKQDRILGLFKAIEVDNMLFIEDLNIENAEFKGIATYSGILAGHINLKSGANINISNVNVEGTINASGCTFGGGLVGRIYSKDGAEINIEKVTVSGNLFMSLSALYDTMINSGGVVGYCDNPYGITNIDDSYSTIGIHTIAQNKVGAYIGGIFGGCNGNVLELNRVCVTGTLMGEAYDKCIGGGFIGNCEVNKIKISNCYMTSLMSMKGTNGWIGGIIGCLKCKETYKDSLFENCHVSGELSARQCAVFIVQNDSTTESVQVQQCYYNKSNKGLNTDDKKITNLGFFTTTRIDCPHGYGIISSQMENKSSFVGWDFDNVWEMRGNGYPELCEDATFQKGLELLDIIPLKGSSILYSEVDGFSNNPIEFCIEFSLYGEYEKSEDISFVIKEYSTDKIVAYAKEEPVIEFIESNYETYCRVRFDPLPDGLRVYPAIENGTLKNSDTGEEFSSLCSKTDWWFSTPEIIKNVWGFKNYKDKIELDIFRMIFSDTKAEKFYKKYKKDLALCAGMVGTLMDFDNDYISYMDFKQDSLIKRIADIKIDAKSEKINMSVDRYIKLSFVLQLLDTVEKQKKHNRNKLKELYEAVIEKKSVYISLKTPNEYHALWGYGIEIGNNYSDILAYDCNEGAIVQRIRLYGSYPDFKKWEYCGVDGCKNLSFVVDYPSACLNRTSDFRNKIMNSESNRYNLLETDLDDFTVIDPYGSAVTNDQIYIQQYDAIIPIIIDSIIDDESSDTDLYWIDSDSKLEVINNDGELKMVSFASDAQIITIDVCDQDNLFVSTDNEKETMDIELKHNNESSFKTIYEFVVNDKIATIELIGNSPDIALINGKKDGMDINGLDISSIEAIYNEKIVKKDLQIPSNEKINVSIEQVSGNTYVTVSYDADKDGIYESDFIPPIPFSELMDTIPIQAIEIEIQGDRIEIGDSVRLVANIQPENATYKKIEWLSSDDSIATISSDGILRAKKRGIVTITAKLDNADIEKTISIEIFDRSVDNKSRELFDNSNTKVKFDDEGREEYFKTSIDQKKGYVNPLMGIITGVGPGFTRWKHDEKGWKLLYADGTYATGMNIIDEEGENHEQIYWELVNSAWFAFGYDGYLKSGFIYDYSLGEWFYIDVNRGMLTGWQYIDNNWYYFNPLSDGKKGKMLVETWVDNYYLNKLGIWEKDKEKS